MRIRLIFLLLLGSVVNLCQSADIFSAPKLKSVLVVFPFDSHTLVQEKTDQIFRQSIEKNLSPIQFFTEYLDLIRSPSRFHQEKISQYLQARYVGQKVDLIVCYSFPALQFWNRYGTKVFPQTPVLFLGVEKRRLQGEHLSPSIAGLTFTFDDILLLDTILKIHPQTQHVFLAGGTTEFERYWSEHHLYNLKAYRPELSYKDLSNLPEPILINTLRHLPPGSIVLFQDLYRTASGRNLQGDDGVRLICQSANVPVYGFFINYVGKGLAGALTIDADTANRAAALGRRLLAGENPASVGIWNDESNRFVFDWRQLKRWGIRESQLPSGSDVLFRPPSFWSLYRGRVLLVIALCLIGSVLLLKLWTQHERRFKADTVVRQLNGQLINAQEQERARIARELHDDVGQQIAAFGIELHSLETKMNKAPAQARENFLQLEDKLQMLAGSIRHISHELHPATLKYAGLSTALRAHCGEFHELTGISVNLGFQPDPLTLPHDVALCLFRISQECLRNTAKHANARCVRLLVEAKESAVEIMITDDGKGFDAELDIVRPGLGLKSMAERVRLLNGSFQVNSQPHVGTTLKARIPLHGYWAMAEC